MADSITTVTENKVEVVVAAEFPYSSERMAEAWVEQLSVRSERTRETYAKGIRSFTRWLDSEGIHALQVRKADVMAYQDSLTKAGRKPTTVKTYLIAVRKFFSWVEENNGQRNPATGVVAPAVSGRSPKAALGVDEATELLNTKAETLEQKRDAAMVSLMCMRGLRTVEVARANVEDLQRIDGKVVLYVQGKGHADRTDFVVLDGHTLRAVYAWLDARAEAMGRPADDAPLFCSLSNRNKGQRVTTRTVSNVARSALAAHGLASAKVTAHSLRHTAVTLALKGGATVQQAQQMARHADINTTMIYAHNLSRIDGEAEQAIDRILAGVA